MEHSTYLRSNQNVHKWITHLYQQSKRGRLSLICGAGISIDAKIPLWHDLVDRIARKVNNLHEDSILHFGLEANPTYLTQIAYEKFINDKLQNVNIPRKIIADEYWVRVVHESLYEDCPDNIDEIIETHPYLRQLAVLAFKCPLVVTFNFDSLLSDVMHTHASKISSDGGEQLTLPDISVTPGLIDKPGATTIFHINGLLPRELKRKRSGSLVFTENAFADAMVATNSLEYNHLLISLSNYTNLIIGHSLTDASLKNLLRGARKRTPAQINYYIYWLPNDSTLSLQVMKDMFNVNIEVYNLITIFATTSDINLILRLINTPKSENFDSSLRETFGATRTRYPYYITGPVASGKTSILRHLRYFQTYEEWVDPVPPLMYQEHNKLTDDERSEVDAWVLTQLVKKNRIMHKTDPGFYFMDRAPLDALVFSKTSKERAQKAAKLSHVFQSIPIVNGQLQFILARGKTLEDRNISRGRLPDDGGNSVYLSKQGKLLKKLYSPKNIFKTDERLAGDVARDIAIGALLDKYFETKLSDILKREITDD